MRTRSIAAALGAASFALSFFGYWRPRAKYFDEVYFARAAEEYLRNLPVYESTHPPLSKLLVTLSVLLFGGLPHGDVSWGWRFLDVVFGAFAVTALFALALRITRSTSFAAVAALLFLFDGMRFVQSRIATPESFAVVFSLLALYALFRYWSEAWERETAGSPRTWRGVASAASGAAVGGCALALAAHAWCGLDTAASAVLAAYGACGIFLAVRCRAFVRSAGWLVAFATALGALIATKWYGVTVLGFGLAALAALARRRAAFRIDAAVVLVIFVAASVYALTWVPDLMRRAPNGVDTVNDVVYRQYAMFDYHAFGVRDATHPYSSKWWEWPLDYVPVAYYYADDRTDRRNSNACCVREITSMPNPAILWFGLFCVPLVGYLAWRERSAAYAFVTGALLSQWLPWMFSPRIAWEYHFFVDVPLVCLCDAIVLQRLWRWGATHADRGSAVVAGILVASYVAIVAGAFAFFYPVLAAQPLSWQAWRARMWLPTWIIGPG